MLGLILILEGISDEQNIADFRCRPARGSDHQSRGSHIGRLDKGDVIYTSQVLESRDPARLHEALDIIPKEPGSRERAGTRFAEVLAKVALEFRSSKAQV